MKSTETQERSNFESHDLILAGLFGACLTGAAIGVLVLLGSF